MYGIRLLCERERGREEKHAEVYIYECMCVYVRVRVCTYIQREELDRVVISHARLFQAFALEKENNKSPERESSARAHVCVGVCGCVCVNIVRKA